MRTTRIALRLGPGLAGVLVVAAISGHSPAHSQANTSSGCGSLENRFGPLDYRNDRGAKLKMVEDYHFGPEVEALLRGMTGSIGSDIDYTLRAYPNHHRALLSMSRLGEKLKTEMPVGAGYTVECYFERAIRFRHDDTTVRQLYAMYLYRNARRSEAERQLAFASELASDNGFTNYNIGLVYLDNQDYQHALVQAHRAIALGFTRTDLKDRLVAAGKWTEPSAAAGPGAASMPSGLRSPAPAVPEPYTASAPR